MELKTEPEEAWSFYISVVCSKVRRGGNTLYIMTVERIKIMSLAW